MPSLIFLFRMISARLRRLLSSWRTSTLSTLNNDFTLITSLNTVTQSYSESSSSRYTRIKPTSSFVLERPRAASPTASLRNVAFWSSRRRCSIIWMKNC